MHSQQFGRYTATQLVAGEPQRVQVGEVAQFRRYRPAQPVVGGQQDVRRITFCSVVYDRLTVDQKDGLFDRTAVKLPGVPKQLYLYTAVLFTACLPPADLKEMLP